MSKMVKLGSSVKDSVTGLNGAVTHMMVQSNGSRWYCFQPKGLNPEDGQPLKRIWVTPDRITGEMVNEPDLPVHVLGTEVIDVASGFKGTAIAITLHISGCVHVEVAPKGTQKKNGQVIDPCDFDIRRLSGKAIPEMTAEERERDQVKKPSPCDTPKMFRE